MADDARPPLHVFHIGKTGGTALNQTLLAHGDESRYRLVFGGHTLTLGDVPAGEKFMFVIRDPLERFVSAFNGRLREDRPRYHYPWRDEEKVAFAIFKTPDELATALSSSDAGTRQQAEGDQHDLGSDEGGKRAEGAVHEPVRVQADAQHVRSEPGQARDDVAKNRHERDSAFSDVTTPAGVEDDGVP